LVTVGSTDKNYRTIAGDVERASGTNFPEEYVDNKTKEEKREVIGKIRSTFLAAFRLSKLLARHHGGPGIKQEGSGKEDEGPKVVPRSSHACTSRELL
jgi:hypothetical protein